MRNFSNLKTICKSLRNSHGLDIDPDKYFSWWIQDSMSSFPDMFPIFGFISN